MLESTKRDHADLLVAARPCNQKEPNCCSFLFSLFDCQLKNASSKQEYLFPKMKKTKTEKDHANLLAAARPCSENGKGLGIFL